LSATLKQIQNDLVYKAGERRWDLHNLVKKEPDINPEWIQRITQEIEVLGIAANLMDKVLDNWKDGTKVLEAWKGGRKIFKKLKHQVDYDRRKIKEETRPVDWTAQTKKLAERGLIENKRIPYK